MQYLGLKTPILKKIGKYYYIIIAPPTGADVLHTSACETSKFMYQFTKRLQLTET